MNDNLNSYIKNIASSASIELMAKARELKEQGKDIISLAGGEPDFDTPEIIKKVAIDELNKGNTHYCVGPGLLKLREGIAKKLKKDNDIQVSADEIAITPGGKMAIYLAVRACVNVGDEVIIPTPSWVSYKEIVVAAGGIPIEVPLCSDNNYKLDEAKIRSKMSAKTKMIIVNSPNNPTGHVLDRNEIMVLEKLVSSKDIYILSDEIYEKIVFDDKKVISLASVQSLRNKTITINGFSKAYAMTGWRIGYVAAKREIIDVINKLFAHTITGVAPFIQEAALAALSCDKEVEDMRYIYQRRRDKFIKGLNQIEGVKASMPEGAFYAWVKFGNGECDSNAIAQMLLEKCGVIGVPGGAYGCVENGYIRFSFANDDKELESALKRIKL